MLWKAASSTVTRSQPDFSTLRNLRRAFTNDEIACIIVNSGNDNGTGKIILSFFLLNYYLAFLFTEYSMYSTQPRLRANVAIDP
jgi:hypothetical protein